MQKTTPLPALVGLLFSFIFTLSAQAQQSCGEIFKTSSDVELFEIAQVENKDRADELLIDPNTNINIKNQFGSTLLQSAIWFKADYVVKKLLSRPDLEINNMDLHYAYHNGNEAILFALINSTRYNINFKDTYGNTILHYAAMDAGPTAPSHIFERMLSSQVSWKLNIVNNRGRTVWEIANESNNGNLLRPLAGLIKRQSEHP